MACKLHLSAATLATEKVVGCVSQEQIGKSAFQNLGEDKTLLKLITDYWPPDDYACRLLFNRTIIKDSTYFPRLINYLKSHIISDTYVYAKHAPLLIYANEQIRQFLLSEAAHYKSQPATYRNFLLKFIGNYLPPDELAAFMKKNIKGETSAVILQTWASIICDRPLPDEIFSLGIQLLLEQRKHYEVGKLADLYCYINDEAVFSKLIFSPDFILNDFANSYCLNPAQAYSLLCKNPPGEDYFTEEKKKQALIKPAGFFYLLANNELSLPEYFPKLLHFIGDLPNESKVIQKVYDFLAQQGDEIFENEQNPQKTYRQVLIDKLTTREDSENKFFILTQILDFNKIDDEEKQKFASGYYEQEICNANILNGKIAEAAGQMTTAAAHYKRFARQKRKEYANNCTYLKELSPWGKEMVYQENKTFLEAMIKKRNSELTDREFCGSLLISAFFNPQEFEQQYEDFSAKMIEGEKISFQEKFLFQLRKARITSPPIKRALKNIYVRRVQQVLATPVSYISSNERDTFFFLYANGELTPAEEDIFYQAISQPNCPKILIETLVPILSAKAESEKLLTEIQSQLQRTDFLSKEDLLDPFNRNLLQIYQALRLRHRQQKQNRRWSEKNQKK